MKKSSKSDEATLIQDTNAEAEAPVSPSLKQLEADALAEEKKAKRKTAVQALKYAVCTASAGLIEFVTFTIFMAVLPISAERHIFFITDVSLLTFVSTLISLTLSILWNFTINRKFTFKSAGNVPRAMLLAFLFYVPFYPFKLWFNGYMPAYFVAEAAAGMGITAAAYLAIYPLATYGAEVISMLTNGVLEFCWQKFVIYRKEADSAVELKYGIGEIGEFGEITVDREPFSGEELREMMSAGVDINAMKEKDMRKWLKTR